MVKQTFEKQLCNIIEDILENGIEKDTRNSITKSLFGQTIMLDLRDNKYPLGIGRKMYPKGVIGEFATLMNGDITNIKQFEDNGCNYWKLWQDNEDGDITLNYGNVFRNSNWPNPLGDDGIDQIMDLVDTLRSNPNDRRMILDQWCPSQLAKLSLPCCWTQLCFNVINDELNLTWTQRSADVMLGVFSDCQLAAMYVYLFAKAAGLKPGRVQMVFTDCHIYSEHYDKAYTYLRQYKEYCSKLGEPEYPECEITLSKDAAYDAIANKNITTDFIKVDLESYNPCAPIKFKLEA